MITDSMITDTDRIEFLESLRDRLIFINKKNPAYFTSTDIHIRGPDHCSIYARTGTGADVEFQGHGKTVREAIDSLLDNQIETQTCLRDRFLRDKELERLRADLKEINDKWLPAHDKLSKTVIEQSEEIERMRPVVDAAIESAENFSVSAELIEAVRDYNVGLGILTWRR